MIDTVEKALRKTVEAKGYMELASKLEIGSDNYRNMMKRWAECIDELPPQWKKEAIAFSTHSFN
jgi:hypothetical protein